MTAKATATAKTPRPKRTPQPKQPPGAALLQKDELEELRRNLLADPQQRAMFSQGSPGRRMYLTTSGQVAAFDAGATRARQVGGPELREAAAPAPALPADWFAWLGEAQPDDDPLLQAGAGRT